ncbi:MAG: hypothetical protein WCO84_00620 [bacterium]
MAIKREVLASSKKIKRKKSFRTFSIFLCLFIFVFVLCAQLSQIERLLIKEVEVSGNKNIPSGEIFDLIKDSLNGRYIGFFPKNNFLYYSKSAMADLIVKKYLRIEKVEIRTDDFEKLKIIVVERTPHYVWCPNRGNSCLYLDNNGLVYDKAPNFSDGVFLRFEGKLDDSIIKLEDYFNKKIFETDKLNKLVKFGEEANKIVSRNMEGKWEVNTIVVKGREDFDYIFKDENDRTWKIMISTGDVGNNYLSANSILKDNTQKSSVTFDSILISTARNLETTLQSKAYLNISTDKNKKIEYIDLRFGNKVFYKFSNDVGGKTATSTSGV